MDDKELVGKKNQIDTEVERSSIEYRPHVTYEPNKPFTVNLPVESSTPGDTDTRPDESAPPLEPAAEQFNTFTQLYTSLENLLTQTESRLKTTVIPVSPAKIKHWQQSSVGVPQVVLDTATIPFDVYKSTFDDPENPANSYIQDLVTSYAEDVEGNLELEFYEDMQEIKATLEEGYFLFQQAILTNYLPEVPLPPLEKNPAYTKQLNDAILERQKANEQITRLFQQKEETYYESLRTEYGNNEFFKKTEAYMKAKRPYDLTLRQEKTTQEMLGLTSRLLNGVYECTGRMKTGLVLGSEIAPEEVMTLLENQAPTREKLAELKQLSQLTLKLQVNQHIQVKRQYRDVLKNINNLSRKKRAHDELLLAVSLRNQLYLKLFDTLHYLESPSKSPGVEAFLNQMAGGLELVQGQYDAFLEEIYLMYTSEFEVRREKIIQTMDKENARAGYLLVAQD